MDLFYLQINSSIEAPPASMAMQIEFAACSCLGSVTFRAPKIQCANKLTRYQ
jgi:hypothetical protein